ncbi:MAG TPA: N-acetyl-gamma-glutamyl-phosphate reductase [Ilumatobacteraceae bacterium]|nr:N-acetyl-gamma-glutamyl-phosphate reductase [Ilumatobacteraceae bacterium]
MVEVGIIGASGYTGAELLRLVAQHPELHVGYATGDTQAGTRAAALYPSLAAAYPDMVFESFDPARAEGLDLVFLGLPHEASMALAPELVGKVGCVVDLSAAYRLKDASLYPQWYGFTHDQPALLAEAVFGLPELHRAELKGARLVATPGCHVTAATLALAPLVRAALIATDGIVVNSITGVSGAGRALKHTSLFCTADEDVNAYGLLDHRHTPEIEQEVGAQVLFTPHLAPMNRGILATCYAKPADGVALSTDSLIAALATFYADEPFVVVGTASPSTKATLGSNAAHLTARYDDRTGTVLVLCAIDNLAKGASGGAVQAANVALGLAETAGLSSIGVYP